MRREKFYNLMMDQAEKILNGKRQDRRKREVDEMLKTIDPKEAYDRKAKAVDQKVNNTMMFYSEMPSLFDKYNHMTKQFAKVFNLLAKRDEQLSAI